MDTDPDPPGRGWPDLECVSDPISRSEQEKYFLLNIMSTL